VLAIALFSAAVLGAHPWTADDRGAVDNLQGQGRGRQGGSPSSRAAAPIDLTGMWVSVVTEDWRWRMRTPPKGDLASLPLTEAAIKAANAWDPARDTAAGEQCRGYGAPAVMRLPGRIRISWENDNTLEIETEAGAQTRLFHFTRPEVPGKPTWQGTSVANWETAGRRGGGARAGSLRVVTNNLRPGYLRKNGVPYSANAQLTEYYNVVTDDTTKDTWLIVTTMVEDPQYLSVPRFVTSSHFKRVDAAGWMPTPCQAE
jgi:hypothetical protein